VVQRSQAVWIAAALGIAVFPASVCGQDNLERYRSGAIDPRVRGVAAEIQQAVFADPERGLEPLTKTLLSGAGDEFLKVKILHDWIADNIAYDVDSYFSGVRADSSWTATLRARRAVCYGYAALLARMCQAAGIRCETVMGYGRGYGYGTGRAETPGEVNHAWNAVQLAGEWRLVDVTWDAGHVEGRAFHKKYRTTYLFPEPRQFVYTHFPKEPGWQRLNPAVSAEQFLNLPHLTGRFFDHRLRLVSQLNRATAAGETVQFALQVPDDVLVMARLKDSAGAEQERRALLARETDKCRVLVAFPQAGRWSVHLFAKPRTDPGMFDQVATLEFQSTAGTRFTFPKTYAAYDALDGCLRSPMFVPLSTGQPMEFCVRVRAGEVQLAVGAQPWQPLARDAREPDTFRLTASVPSGAAAKLVTKDPRTGGYTTLVDFSSSSP